MSGSYWKKDTKIFDDIEIVFYLLIYFMNGELPYKKRKNK